MIKILNIISDSNIGGAGRCLLNFLKYYDRKKFAVKVVVPKGSLLKAEIEKFGLDLVGVLPQDETVYRCDCEGKPSAKVPDTTPVKQALSKIMEKLGF